jgi:hypothetical protein
MKPAIVNILYGGFNKFKYLVSKFIKYSLFFLVVLESQYYKTIKEILLNPYLRTAFFKYNTSCIIY